MEKSKRLVKTTQGIQEYTYLGCPLTLSNSAWCYRMCDPDSEGKGRCGRIAPHTLKSYIQTNIEEHNLKKQKMHLEKLENMYLSDPVNKEFNPGVTILEGEAEIHIPVRKKVSNADGSIIGCICYKLMEDAAILAVNSIVNDVQVSASNFNVYLSNTAASRELTARAKFMGNSGNQILVETVVLDDNRNEIARGNGAFIKSSTELNQLDGYK